MAEIKSTMDLVMERAARMGKASSEELQQEEARKEGMRLAADYLAGKLASLAAELETKDPALQMIIRQGMIEGLMRNLSLPRDEIQKQRGDRAADGLVELSGGAGDIAAICQEMGHILGQYNQHRDQLRTQLEEQVRMQYEQLMGQQGAMPPGDMKLEATLQQKFQEEWARIENELSGQYNQALEQHKTVLKQRLGV
ncbi:hypothetical protein GF1_32120 [Desulfolithobacter dissulfuricans]|uniref:Uncharacterized protein n=1 Tax=Desulfolithobacter dissulfuricans TaxID=2795293 RepID=A0A915UBB1_9BACT|nr:hypothetical protein [Desulfolithobacter dissulfuricans]BCO10836.1 hypothetical protein GF1_32120 [Desulfolithobacter dissulfuricans]